MKSQLALAAFALAVSTTASAVALNFNNGSGSYSAGGITATVTTTGGSLHYSALQPGGGSIGVGLGAMTYLPYETMTVTFNRSVRLNTVSFTSWNGGVDRVEMSYSGGSKVFTNSLLNLSLIDTFSADGVTLNSFTLSPGNYLTAVYLHGLDASVSEVPVPGAAWLLGSGLAGLAGFARRRKAAAAL